MEGNNGDSRQYHITEAGFCHFNCNTTTWRGPDITSLPCMSSTSLSRNGFKRYLTEFLGLSSTGEEQNQRLWLAFMSCCLARSDDKSDGREGVGDLSKHGSDKIDWERPELVFEFVSSLPWGGKTVRCGKHMLTLWECHSHLRLRHHTLPSLHPSIHMIAHAPWHPSHLPS